MRISEDLLRKELALKELGACLRRLFELELSQRGLTKEVSYYYYVFLRRQPHVRSSIMHYLTNENRGIASSSF